jgi:hypothetical protein
LGIIKVDFDATGQLRIIYSELVKSLRKNRNRIKHCFIIYILQENASFSELVSLV